MRRDVPRLSSPWDSSLGSVLKGMNTNTPKGLMACQATQPLTWYVPLWLLVCSNHWGAFGQITQDAFFRVICAREELWQEPRWWQEVFLHLYFNNWLWANMIWGGEQLWRMDHSKVNGLVLIDLLWMGILDWSGPNVQKNILTQAMHHVIVRATLPPSMLFADCALRHYLS